MDLVLLLACGNRDRAAACDFHRPGSVTEAIPWILKIPSPMQTCPHLDLAVTGFISEEKAKGEPQ
jgi:hypothetical protein